MKRTLSALLLIVLTISLALVGTSAAQDSTTRPFAPLDRGFGYEFDYPIETHSVRTSNLAQPTVEIFGAFISVEPNDSYVYGADPHATYTTRMRVLAIPTDSAELTADALRAVAGTLPLARYDASVLSVTDTTLGGEPAIRVDGIETSPSATTSEIIAFRHGILYEIVIEPVSLGLGFDPNIEMVIDPVYESILASWRWTES